MCNVKHILRLFDFFICFSGTEQNISTYTNVEVGQFGSFIKNYKHKVH